MSLLEDVFLEDEAGEAQELERVIEGDEFDERPRTPDSNSDSEKEDEAEEDKRRVDHTEKAKRVVKNPRFVLNPARLTGPRGIQVLPDHFKDFKFKGKGHEREDLDVVLKKLEHWAYRLYPKFKFDDCLKKIETLGKKRPVMVHLHKIRTDQHLSEETVVQQDSSGDEAAPELPEEDEFDRLLQQQIELARATPAPGSVRKELHTPKQSVVNRSPLTAPKVISSPSISDDQKERMMRNRKLAEERRIARLNQLNKPENLEHEKEKSMEVIEEIVEINPLVDEENDDAPVARKHNRSNVIDSSDDETDIVAVNESIKVDVHNHVQNRETDSDKENADVREEQKNANESIDVVIESDSDKENADVREEQKNANESIDVVIESVNTETAIESDEPEITRENLKKGEAVLEKDNNYEIAEGDLPNDNVVFENETYLHNRELPNEKNKISDHDKQESTKDDTEEKEKLAENDETSVIEDLMDVDFSDDF